MCDVCEQELRAEVSRLEAQRDTLNEDLARERREFREVRLGLLRMRDEARSALTASRAEAERLQREVEARRLERDDARASARNAFADAQEARAEADRLRGALREALAVLARWTEHFVDKPWWQPMAQITHALRDRLRALAASPRETAPAAAPSSSPETTP